jgi:hypothetical protein
MEDIKKFLFAFFIFMLLTINESNSQSRGFGVGVILGSPTGLSGKYWTSSVNAFDFGLGYSFEKNSNLYLHSDYLFHIGRSLNTPERISIYYGPGIRLLFREDNNSRLGIRGVLGGIWMPRGTSIDVFVEIAPVMDLIPSTNFSFDGGIGVRFFLN